MKTKLLLILILDFICISVFPQGVSSIAIHPEKPILVFAKNGKVEIWDIENELFVKDLDVYSQYIKTVKFSPSGKYLAAYGTGKVLVWESKDFSLVDIYDDEYGPICFSFDDKYLAMKKSIWINLYDIEQHIKAITDKSAFFAARPIKLLHYSNNGSNNISFAFSPNNEFLATISKKPGVSNIVSHDDEMTILWSIKSFSPVDTFYTNIPNLKCIVFDDNNRLIGIAEENIAGEMKNQFVFYDISVGNKLISPFISNISFTIWINENLIVLKNERFIARLCDNCREMLLIFDYKANLRIETFEPIQSKYDVGGYYSLNIDKSGNLFLGGLDVVYKYKIEP